MAKTSFALRLRNLFSGPSQGETFLDELEDMLVEGDVGIHAAMESVDELKSVISQKKTRNPDELLNSLKEILNKKVRAVDVRLQKNAVNFFLVLGVNGVGKTTTIAKLADYYRRSEKVQRILLSAGDTFRAAAIEQLNAHGERLGVKVVSQEKGSDPGAVIYDTLERALAREVELVLADTAGRMHNKSNLVKELEKINNIIGKKIGNGSSHKMLVIDATTGQNGYRQAEVFHEAIGIDSIFLAKYDSAAKGGIAIAIAQGIGIPVSFIGTGEKYNDIKVFDSDAYLNALLGIA